MPNLFEKATTWLPEMVEAAAGITLTITRGVQSTADVVATVGQVAFRLDSEEGRRIEVGDRDYLISASVYKIGGVAVTPRLGDRFQETGASEVWELQDPDTGEPAWRWSDGEQRTVYRLHVKKVG